jgi:group I intron endonuclease
MAVVYQHKKKGTDQVFYIGISTNMRRPFERDKRSDHWRSIVNKYGFDVQIIVQDVSWEEAKSWETYLIRLLGRKDFNQGHLVNKTDGGEGMLGNGGVNNPWYGRKHTAETKAKIAAARKGKYSGVNSHSYGKPRSEETKRKIAQANSNPSEETRMKMAGSKFKKVIDTSTGIIYGSVKDAANTLGINYATLKNRLNRNKVQKGTVKYL